VEDKGRDRGSKVVDRTRMGQSAFYILDEFPTGDLVSVETRGVPWLDPIPGSRIPFVAVSVAESASVVRG
jgi:hypothetical protein